MSGLIQFILADILMMLHLTKKYCFNPYFSMHFSVLWGDNQYAYMHVCVTPTLTHTHARTRTHTHTHTHTCLSVEKVRLFMEHSC